MRFKTRGKNLPKNNTTQFNTRHTKKTQHNTTQHNTPHIDNTTQHNTTQHNTTKRPSLRFGFKLRFRVQDRVKVRVFKKTQTGQTKKRKEKWRTITITDGFRFQPPSQPSLGSFVVVVT
jgi:hypothetical protein